MSDDADLARGWFRKAQSDLQTARLTISAGGPFDTACFHAQQAVEKCLKGFLVASGQAFPRTHSLEELGRLCPEVDPDLDLPAIDLAELTPFAVELRYDFEFWPDAQTAADALAVAERIRAVVLGALPE